MDYSDLQIDRLITETNNVEEFPNGIKVSETYNPLLFKAEHTYQVGSEGIVALCSNAVAIGTGQTGASPLFVFCSDGIYALVVDSDGEMAYTNARIIARDVCNNGKSVTPIDSGIVFTTDRGLYIIEGSNATEIGDSVEGEYIVSGAAASPISELFDNKLYCGLNGRSAWTRAEFKEYLRNSIINYNHNEKELMVSNPEYSYSYVRDQYGNWSRRKYRATQYINDYPTSYRLDSLRMYRVDEEDVDEVGVPVFIMSDPMKLDSIGFKSIRRFIARGYFHNAPHPDDDTRHTKLSLCVFGSYDGRRWSLIGHREKSSRDADTGYNDIGCDVSHGSCKFFMYVLAGRLQKDSRLDYIEVQSEQSELSTKPR